MQAEQAANNGEGWEGITLLLFEEYSLLRMLDLLRT